MIKRVGVLIILIVILCGCDNKEKKIEKHLETYIDKETCIEYFANYTYYEHYVLTPKYDKSGNVKINKDCILNKGGNK